MPVDEKFHFWHTFDASAPAVSGDSPRPCLEETRPRRPICYSHSMVDGGFDVMSSTTRFTAGTSLTIRDEIVSSRS